MSLNMRDATNVTYQSRHLHTFNYSSQAGCEPLSLKGKSHNNPFNHHKLFQAQIFLKVFLCVILHGNVQHADSDQAAGFKALRGRLA